MGRTLLGQSLKAVLLKTSFDHLLKWKKKYSKMDVFWWRYQDLDVLYLVRIRFHTCDVGIWLIHNFIIIPKFKTASTKLWRKGVGHLSHWCTWTTTKWSKSGRQMTATFFFWKLEHSQRESDEQFCNFTLFFMVYPRSFSRTVWDLGHCEWKFWTSWIHPGSEGCRRR